LHHDFEWDPSKARTNSRKHGVTFERATEVFLDPVALSVFDGRHSDTEDRYVTIGTDSRDVSIVVVHTFRQEGPNHDTIRIISARKATKREREQFAKGSR